MKKLTVADYMTPAPYTIEPTQSLSDAEKLMEEKDVRHLPVVHEGRIVGLLSQRDVRLLRALSEVPADKVRIALAMIEEPLTIAPETPLEEAAERMAAKKYGSAVVARGDRLVGVFTTIDALRALADLMRGVPRRPLVRHARRSA